MGLLLFQLSQPKSKQYIKYKFNHSHFFLSMSLPKCRFLSPGFKEEAALLYMTDNEKEVIYPLIKSYDNNPMTGDERVLLFSQIIGQLVNGAKNKKLNCLLAAVQTNKLEKIKKHVSIAYRTSSNPQCGGKGYTLVEMIDQLLAERQKNNENPL